MLLDGCLFTISSDNIQAYSLDRIKGASVSSWNSPKQCLRVYNMFAGAYVCGSGFLLCKQTDHYEAKWALTGTKCKRNSEQTVEK